MARNLSGGRNAAPVNRVQAVSGSDGTVALRRVLGRGSQLALRAGSDANLTLSGARIGTGAPLPVGSSQVALIRESTGAGAAARAVEYSVTLTRAATGPVTGPAPSPGGYLPASASLAGVYALARLIPGYDGPALRVRRVSDGAEQDIGFFGQALDVAAAQAFMNASALCVARVYDQTGRGADLVQPLAAAQPGLWLGEGGPSVTNYTGDCPLLIPAALSIERTDCAVFMVARTPGQAATCGYWAFGGARADFALTSPRTAGSQSPQPMVDGVSIVTSTQNPRALGVNGMAVLGLVSSAAGQVVHRDGEIAAYPPAAAATLAGGGEVGEAIEYDGRTDWRAFVVCSAAPADIHVAAIKTALAEAFATTAPAVLSILAGGDSIVFGTGGANNRTITAAIQHRSGPGVLVRNVAIAGHRLDMHYADFDARTAAYITPGVPNVYFANYGHNDIKTVVTDAATGASCVATMQAQARDMAAALRAYGFNVVIWQEALADTGFTAAQESARDAWNAWLRSNPLGDDGLPCFDAIDLVASDPRFVLSDAETDEGRGMALTANSSDGIHPNEVHAGARAEHLLATYAAIPFALRLVAPAGQQGLAYATPAARLVKGSLPCVFALAPGSTALPAGLSLDFESGVISGTPAQAGITAGIVLRATDAEGRSADAALTLSIAAAPAIGVVEQVESWVSVDATNVSVVLPSSVAVGDLLVAIATIDGNPALTWDDATAGAWTQAALYLSNLNAHTLAIFTRVADGTEGGKQLNLGLASAQQAVIRVLRVTGASGKLEVSSYARGSSAAGDPPVLTPSWPGASLIVAAMGLDGTGTVLSGPAGYMGLSSRASSASGQSTNATAWRIASGTQDPGTFAFSASGQWIGATVAIEPDQTGVLPNA